jgi:hypothetical protein
MDESQKPRISWWQTLPGVLTAAAAAATAIAGLIGVLHQAGVIGGGNEKKPAAVKESITSPSTYLRIDGITAFNLIPTPTVRVTAYVNGTQFHYPSLAGIEWLDVAPSMSSQTFRLPAAERYEIRFEMETKGNANVPPGVPYVSQETVIVDKLPFKGEYNVFQARREGTTMSRAGGPGAAVRFSIERN